MSLLITKQNNEKLQYDTLAKKVLSHKEILAYIMKNVLEEYRNETIDDIIHKYIETVDYDNPIIIGNQTENTYAGKIVYDILFTATKPHTKTNVLINIEAQKDDVSSYELVRRGFYYSSCLLADQKNKYFEKMNYQDSIKNYSIWIVMNSKQARQGNIDLFTTKHYNVVGNSAYNKEDYELMNVIIIYLDSTNEERNDVVGMLSLLFSKQTEVEEKVKRLQEEYGIQVNDNLEEEMSTMCNLAQGLIDEAKLEAKDKWLQIGLEIGEKKGEKKGEEKGEKKGEKKGEEKMAQLFSLLMENGQYELMERATKDKQLRHELYKKYHIS